MVKRSTEISAIPNNQGRDNAISHELVAIINQAKKDIHTFFGASNGLTFVGESGAELLFD